MTKNIRGYAVRASKAGPITFLASTSGIARDGMIIEAGAWDLTAYRANPIVLWAHDYRGDRLPIGRATRVEETSAGLVADLVFDQDDEFAVQVERKIRNNYLNAVSVGWDTHEAVGNRQTKVELLDISVVPVPGDANALALARSAYKSTKASPITASQLRSLSRTELEKLHKAICGPSRPRKSDAFDELAKIWPRLTGHQKSRFLSNLKTYRRKAA